jgi:hypothetical protein
MIHIQFNVNKYYRITVRKIQRNSWQKKKRIYPYPGFENSPRTRVKTHYCCVFWTTSYMKSLYGQSLYFFL